MGDSTRTGGPEGELIAIELIEEILKETLEISHWDIATKGRRLAASNGRLLMETAVESKMGPYDICSVIRDYTPSRILTGYTLRDGHVEVVQLKCVDQKASGYCGHYAVHFALCLSEMCSSVASYEDVVGYLNETESVGGYWRRYWLSISHLMARACEEDMWPWNCDHVLSGDMERSFLRHLMEVDDHLSVIGKHIDIVVLQYSFGIIKHTFNDVCDIHNKISAFINSPVPTHMIFILGVTNHWVTLLVYKTNSTCSCGCGRDRVGVVYTDSNNVPTISYTDGDIEGHIVTQEKERIKMKGEGYPTWRKNVIRQAYHDQRAAVHMICRYISGCDDIRRDLAHDYINGMLDSFDNDVRGGVAVGGATDLYLLLLIEWLDNSHPPKVIRETLSPFLSNKEVVAMDTLNRLEVWSRETYFCLHDDIQPLGISSVDSFITVLQFILGHF
jgi:hypothetical protein